MEPEYPRRRGLRQALDSPEAVSEIHRGSTARVHFPQPATQVTPVPNSPDLSAERERRLRIVTDGLQPADRVVVEGVQKVFFPGMPVKESLVPMSGAAAVAQTAAVAAR